MGLDMYAMATTQAPESKTDFKVDDCFEIHYWRKHPNLYGWMEQRYYDKGGTQEFNCTMLLLTKQDLIKLDSDIRSGILPDTEGFFFGRSDGDETADDLQFIGKARELLDQGLSVFYDSWW